MKTKEQIQDLKLNWRNDPNWDIEKTDGFEEYHDELLRYRLECEKRWATQDQQRKVKMSSSQYNIDRAIEMIDSFHLTSAQMFGTTDAIRMSMAHSLLAIASELKRMNDMK